MTHPLIGDLAKAHLAELHASAARQRLVNEAASHRRLALSEVRSAGTPHLGARRKAGWWLVGIGLRLATGSADA